MPSSGKAYRAIEALAERTQDSPILDLGSGWGHVVIRLARRFPNRPVHGYELSLLPWATSVLLKHLLRLDNLTLHRQDFFIATWPQQSVLVCYLFGSAMSKLAERLQVNEDSTQAVISNNFALPGFTATEKNHISDFYRSPIYYYEIMTVKSAKPST